MMGDGERESSRFGCSFGLIGTLLVLVERNVEDVVGRGGRGEAGGGETGDLQGNRCSPAAESDAVGVVGGDEIRSVSMTYPCKDERALLLL